MFSRTLAFAVVLLGLFSLTACSSPRFDHIAVRVEDIKPEGDALLLTLRFINTNNVPLVVSGTSHSLTINNRRIDRITGKDAVGVPPMGTTTQDIRLSAALAKTVRELTASDPGHITYQIESALQIAWEDDTFTYTTASKGVLSLKSQDHP